MNGIPTLSLAGTHITLYSLLAILFSLAAACWSGIRFRQKGMRSFEGFLCCALCAVLGLFLGRLIFCAVRSSVMFYDPLGRFAGLSPFFQLQIGSLSVIGVITGCLLSGVLYARCTRKETGKVMDALALPGVWLFAVMRFVEPLSKQGYGPQVTAPFLCFAPLSIQNGWGGWNLSICFIEGVLLSAVALGLMFHKTKKSGTTALLALLLVSASQLLPESLRRDDVLRIFIFARITQMGFAVLFFLSAVLGWVRSKKQGLPGKRIALECALVLVSMVLLIGGEFALDKTQWPDGLIYLVMLAIILFMTVLAVRRLHRGDCTEK